jgi:colanic acid/amylovoran biosynthesis protein
LGPIAPAAREIVESDLVIALPGGYLQSLQWQDDYWLFHWLLLSMAKAANKPVVIYAQSIGPFDRVHQIWAKKLLRRIDVLSVREEFSEQRLHDYGVASDRIVLVPDAAFGLTSDSRSQEEFAKFSKWLDSHPHPWIGVSVREHQFPGAPDPDACMDHYIGEVAKAADRMIELATGTVFFVPQCIKSGGQDIQVSGAVIERMQHRNHAVIVDADLSPLTLQQLYGQFEMLIGTRMHANILAMCAGAPVAAIAYERKTNGIMKMIGLDDCVIDIDAIIGGLVPLVERVFAARLRIREHLKNAIPPIRDRAIATPTILLQMLNAQRT